MMKVCTKCNIEKNISEFYRHGNNGGYRGACKDCHSLVGKEYHKLNSKTGYFIYRLMRNKRIVYVGKTTNLDRRIKEHRKSRIFSYVEYIEFNTEVDMILSELYFINRYKPLENKQDLQSSQMMQIKSLDELIWIDYSLKDCISIKNIKNEINKAYDEIEDIMIRIEKLKLLLNEDIFRDKNIDLRINTNKKYELTDVNLPPNYKDMQKTILAFTVDGSFIGEYKTVKDVCKSLNVDDGSVYRCCMRIRKNHKGYTFRYNFKNII